MNPQVLRVGLAVAAAGAVAVTTVVAAQGDPGHDHGSKTVRAVLTGYNEDPVGVVHTGPRVLLGDSRPARPGDPLRTAIRRTADHGPPGPHPLRQPLAVGRDQHLPVHEPRERTRGNADVSGLGHGHRHHHACRRHRPRWAGHRGPVSSASSSTRSRRARPT